MILIEDNDIRRGGEKIGWYENNRIYNRHGDKLGYFIDEKIYDVHGRKIAYLEGEYLYTEYGDRKARLEEICKNVSGGILSDDARCAIYLFLGD